MRPLMRFIRDEAGSATRHFAAVAIVVGLGSLAVASMLDTATHKGSPSAIAFLLPEDPSRVGHGTQGAASRMAELNGLDQSPTGSISRPILLNPCTGELK